MKKTILLLFILISSSSFSQQRILHDSDINKFYNVDSTKVFFASKDNKLLTGRYKIIQENGTYNLVFLKKGVIQEEHSFYDHKGKIKRKTLYKEGKKTGVELVYGSGLNIVGERKFDEGRLHGETKYYSEAGLLRMKEMYNEGKLDVSEYYDKDGSLLTKINH